MLRLFIAGYRLKAVLVAGELSGDFTDLGNCAIKSRDLWASGSGTPHDMSKLLADYANFVSDTFSRFGFSRPVTSLQVAASCFITWVGDTY